MLHTRVTDRDMRPVAAVAAAHVWCRARTWRVLDLHRAEDTSLWHLARGNEVPRVIASPPDEISPARMRRRAVSRRTWIRDAIAHLRSHAPVWWPATATSLPVAALPWQFVPSMMILSGHHRRLLLADAVGMGKTVQAGVLLHEIHSREPDAATLVIAPATLVAQWATELRVRAHLTPSVLDASALRREADCPRSVVDAARAGTCWLMSVDLLRQPDVVALVGRTRWTLLVVDEAHAAAPGTARLEAVTRVANASVRVLLLTATPSASGAADGLRRLGARPGEALMPVVRRNASLLSRPTRRSRTLIVDLGVDHAALCARLDRFVERARVESGARGLLPALVLRRRASSCPAALRRSIERRLDVLGTPAMGDTPSVDAWLFELDPRANQDAQDDEAMRVVAWSDAEAERKELEVLLALARQLPPGGWKLACVERLVRRCREPVVVFTAFLDTLRALRALLPAAGVVMVHGEQPDALRAHAIRSFTTGDAMVLLATDTAAEGLNLHARCRLVIHAEVPASNRVFEQRTGRLDRYGQSRRVHAVVMSSRTREDREATDRLRTHALREEQWVTDLRVSRCRRSAVAARRLALEIAQVEARSGAGARSRDAPAIRACRMPPRRWRRLASRLGLPIGTSALWTATLRVAGGPQLSTSRVPVFAGTHSDAPPDLTTMQWRGVVRGRLTRAGWLVRRLTSWDNDATRAIEVEASTRGTLDLFADPTRDDRRPARRQSELWVAMEGETTIGTAAGVR